jgi:hypothetical protein
LEQNEFIKSSTISKHLAIEIEFKTKVQIKEDLNKEKYFSYGALFYAKPIDAIEQKDNNRFQFILNNQATFSDGKITINAKNKTTNQIESITLIPFGKTILRQVRF